MPVNQRLGVASGPALGSAPGMNWQGHQGALRGRLAARQLRRAAGGVLIKAVIDGARARLSPTHPAEVEPWPSSQHHSAGWQRPRGRLWRSPGWTGAAVAHSSSPGRPESEAAQP